MKVPRVATVLSAREWEASLVTEARTSASVRLVRRAFQPGEILDDADRIDLVIAGAETSWVTPARIGMWRRAGLRVIGIHPRGDEPARLRLLEGRCDDVLPDDTHPGSLLLTAQLLQPAEPIPDPDSRPAAVVGVAGPRGAPGRTEIAVALGLNWASQAETLLLDLDRDAPSLAVRLGLAPRPDLADVTEHVHASGRFPSQLAHRIGRLGVVVGSHRPGDIELSPTAIEDVVETATASAQIVVIDLGPRPSDDPLHKRLDHAVLVADGSATGLVRVARLVAEWAGPKPLLVLNRVPPRERDDIVTAARRWTGLEPAVLLPDRPGVRRASRRASRPDRTITRLLRLPVPYE